MRLAIARDELRAALDAPPYTYDPARKMCVRFAGEGPPLYCDTPEECGACERRCIRPNPALDWMEREIAAGRIKDPAQGPVPVGDGDGPNGPALPMHWPVEMAEPGFSLDAADAKTLARALGVSEGIVNKWRAQWGTPNPTGGQP